jgi:predicted MFS family arabinose efflux permease
MTVTFDRTRQLSDGKLYLLAAASAVITANAYYIHPIISQVAKHFGVSAAMIGLVPACNQIALALGIFLLLPLGDWVSNRRLTSIFVAMQWLAVTGMALADHFVLFVLSSTVLGFFTIAPYLMPAYVSKRVSSDRLGRATALLTTGVIGGVLLARVGAGVVAEHFGWRAVYVMAAALMLIVSVLLPSIMEERERGREPQPSHTYLGLLRSIPPLVAAHPEVLLSAVIQALSFGIFLSVWMGLGLHLTSAQMGYGVDVVGYLALVSMLNLVMTPRLGAWADKIGPQRARCFVACVQFTGVVCLEFTGSSLWLLVWPLALMGSVSPAIDVTGRMTLLKEAAHIRTRLMTVYVVVMFMGGGVASWAGTIAYDVAGWHGSATLSLLLSSLVLTLSLVSLRRSQVAAMRQTAKG